MKYFLPFIIFILNSSIFFAQQNYNHTINGEIKGVDKGKIALYYNGNKFKQKIVDGKFEFKGFIDSTFRARLKYKQLKSQLFYLDSCNIKLAITIDKKFVKGMDSPGLSLENISGSLTNDLEQDYKKFYSENFGQPIYNYLLYNYLSKKIDKHPNNRLYFDLLYSFSRRQKYLNYKQFLVLANILDMSNRTYYQKNRFFRNLQNAMYLGIGSQFPTANLFTTDGKTVNLKDQLGNVTLILISDYKSWTSLDIHEETLKLHEKYHPKGYNFLVVQLLDKDETPYLKTTDNTLGWINFYSSDLTDKLKLSWGGFQSIEYLVDDSGKIIAINLSTSELEKVLKSRL